MLPCGTNRASSGNGQSTISETAFSLNCMNAISATAVIALPASKARNVRFKVDVFEQESFASHSDVRLTAYFSCKHVTNHCGEAASEKCFSAATFVRRRCGRAA